MADRCPVRLLPLASPLQDAGLTASLVAEAQQLLARLGYEASLVDDGEELPSLEPAILLVASGGTEHRALEAVRPQRDPVVVLAQGGHNSLPAALEVLARLQQDGRRGAVIQLDGDSAEERRLRQVLAAVAAGRSLSGATLALVGRSSPWLIASSWEGEAGVSALGCRVICLEIAELLDAWRAVDEADAARVARELAAPDRSRPEAEIVLAVRLYLALRELARRHGLAALTVRCFDLIEATKSTACLALSMLNDEGVVAGCEGDLPALDTMLLLSTLSGRPAFMGNLQQVSLDAGTLWLTHCTVARSLCSEHAFDTHFETGRGVAVAGAVHRGAATLARLGRGQRPRLFAADGEVVGCGASPQRCRTQVQVRLHGGVEELLHRPLGNHHVLVPGHWAGAAEAFRDLFL